MPKDCFTVKNFRIDNNEISVEQKLCEQFNFTPDSEEFKKIAWLGFFEDTKIGINDEEDMNEKEVNDRLKTSDIVLQKKNKM